MEHPYDPALVASIERRQRDYLLAGGFDLNAFAKRTDLVEFGPGRRLIMRVAASVLRWSGRGALADNIDGLLDYMRRVEPKAAELPARQAAVEAMFAGPATRYQRRDDHYFLCTMRDLIKSSRRREQVDDDWREFCATADRTLLATAPIGRCNAVIEPNRARDRFAMLMDDEMGRLASQIGLLFAGLVRETESGIALDPSAAAGTLDRGGRTARAYESMVDAFVERGSTLFAAPSLPRSDFEVMAAGGLASVAAAWAISHELAHAHLGHASRSASSRGLMDADDESEEDQAALAFLIEAEFEADAFAKGVARGVCTHCGCDPAVASAAAAGYLVTYESVYGVIADKIADDAPKERRDEVIRRVFRHPTPEERLARLLSQDDPAEANLLTVIERLRECARSKPIGRIHPRWSKLADAFAAIER